MFPDMPVRLRSCAPIANTGLQRPVYTLVLEGIPEGWTEHTVRSGDSRVPDKTWAVLQRGPRKTAYQTVRRNASMVRQPATGGRQGPPEQAANEPAVGALAAEPPDGGGAPQGGRDAPEKGGGGAAEPALADDGDEELL